MKKLWQMIFELWQVIYLLRSEREEEKAQVGELLTPLEHHVRVISKSRGSKLHALGTRLGVQAPILPEVMPIKGNHKKVMVRGGFLPDPLRWREAFKMNSNAYRIPYDMERVVQVMTETICLNGLDTMGSPIAAGEWDIVQKARHAVLDFMGYSSQTHGVEFMVSGYQLFEFIVETLTMLGNDSGAYKPFVFHESKLHESTANILGLMAPYVEETVTFDPHDLDALEQTLFEYMGDPTNVRTLNENRAWMIFNLAGSTGGKLPDVPAICEIAHKYGVFVVVDGAHAVFNFGYKNRGFHWSEGQHLPDIIATTGSKSANSVAFMVAPKEFVQVAKFASRRVFHAGVPAHMLAVLIEVIRQYTEMPEQTVHMANMRALLVDLLVEGGVNMTYEHNESCVFSVQFAGVSGQIMQNKKAVEFHNLLIEEGVFANAFFSPAVKTPCERFSVTSVMEENDIRKIAEIIIYCWNQCK